MQGTLLAQVMLARKSQVSMPHSKGNKPGRRDQLVAQDQPAGQAQHHPFRCACTDARVFHNACGMQKEREAELHAG